jgi:hypothetical protein
MKRGEKEIGGIESPMLGGRILPFRWTERLMTDLLGAVDRCDADGAMLASAC